MSTHAADLKHNTQKETHTMPKETNTIENNISSTYSCIIYILAWSQVILPVSLLAIPKENIFL